VQARRTGFGFTTGPMIPTHSGKIVPAFTSPMLRNSRRIPSGVHRGLIVRGNRGHSELWGRVMGHTADRVSENAHCDMLIVRADDLPE
jgi:hypothetical protein